MSFLNFSVSAIVVFGLPLYYKVLTLYSQGARDISGDRGDRIRTYDLCFPKAAFYQTELHPEEVGSSSPLLQNLPKRSTAAKRGGGGW